MDAVRSFFAVFTALALASGTLAAYAAPSVSKSTDLISSTKDMVKVFIAPFANANKTNASAAYRATATAPQKTATTAAVNAATARTTAATAAGAKTAARANESGFVDKSKQNLETLEKIAIATDQTIDRAPMSGTINANSVSRIAFYRSGSKYYADAFLSPELPMEVSVRGNAQTRQLQKVGFEFSDFADAAGAYVMLRAFAKDSLQGAYINFEPESCAPLTASGNPISCAVKGDKSGAFRLYETIR